MTFIVHIADVSRYQREILNMQSGVHRPRKHYIIMPLKLMCVYSQYSIHHTRLRQSSSGFLECIVRPSGQIIEDITTIGSEKFKILTSPGFTVNVP